MSVLQGGMVRYVSNQAGIVLKVRTASSRQLLRRTFVLGAEMALSLRNERAGKSQVARSDPSGQAILKENPNFFFFLRSISKDSHAFIHLG